MLLALIPLLFVGIGAWGLWWSLRRLRKSRAKKAEGPAAEDVAGGGSPARGPRLLKSDEGSPRTRPIFMLFFALFWNGIVSIFVSEVVHEWRAGQSPRGLTLFLVPFVVVGVAFVGGVVYFFLALFNPRVRVTASPGEVRLGEPVDFSWEVDGSAERIRRFRVSVEGREEAQCGTGKGRHLAKEAFFRAELVDLADTMALVSGRARFDVPSGTMHSFAAGSTKITWRVVVRGEIDRWPDVKEEFVFTVLPQSGAGGGDRNA